MMKDWNSVLVKSGVALKEAVAAIDKSALRIALVVDDERKLLGTLTDGDIRRALLNHTSLDVRVDDVMCRSPRTAMPDWSRDRLLSIMETNELLQLPLVDSAGVVVGLETLHGVLDKTRKSTPVFLMAGGFGTRLHPLTEKCPKPLLKVGEKPLLEFTLERLTHAGFYKFYVSTHYLPEMIREYFGDGSRWGVNISYTQEKEPLGTGGALGLLPKDEITEPLLLMNGDVLTTINFQSMLDFHIEKQSIATMAVRSHEYQVPYGVVENEGHQLRSIVEKPVQKYFVNAGVYVLEPELIRSVELNVHIDMPVLLEKWMNKGKQVSAFPINEYWLDIGRVEDFNRAQTEFKDLAA